MECNVPGVQEGTSGGIKTLVEIAYAIHDHYGSYYKYLGVSLLSVMENTGEKLRFHILCDRTVTDNARKELKALCKSFDNVILFHDIALDERISLTELLEAGYCEGILYRLYLPELLPDLPKIIYLDCDVLANGDIKGLWEMDAGDICAAGRWDPPLVGFIPTTGEKAKRMQPFLDETDWNRYINSGVLLLNLDRIRRSHHLLEEAIAFLERYAYRLPDQDAINYILRGETGFIPACYNMPNKDLPQVWEGFFYHYSYIGADVDKLDPIDKLYLDYWKRSPFYDDSIGKKERIKFLRDLKNRSEVYERLEAIRPLTPQEMLCYCIQLYLKGDYQDCCDRLSRMELFPGSIMLMAKSLRAMDRITEAIALLQENLKKQGISPYTTKTESELELWDMLGELLYDDAQYEKAQEAYKRAMCFGDISRDAVAIRALMHLIKCAIRLEDLSAAKEYYMMLTTLRPIDDSVKVYGLQIEIAERKLASKQKSTE